MKRTMDIIYHLAVVVFLMLAVTKAPHHLLQDGIWSKWYIPQQQTDNQGSGRDYDDEDEESDSDED